MTTQNQMIVLASRPKGEVTPQNFRLQESTLPDLADGEVLVKNHFLSLDPYMRGRMDEGKSYVPPQPLDKVMEGGTAGEIIASKHPGFAVGDKVTGRLGWQMFAISNGTGLIKVDTTQVPLSAYLGCVGMPGVTAWYGLNQIIAPKAGETVVVSAASGAVGSVVGQLAKAKGCRVVGVAGGPDKCRAVVEEYGFDACIDYKAGNLAADLKAATPDGIDGYFENTGGEILDLVLARMNAFGRIAVCGLIASYDGQSIPVSNIRAILISRLTMRGFIISEHPQFWPQALQELGAAVASGKLRYRETLAQGLASAPEAFMGLLKGRNFGKQLVKLV